MHVQEAKTIHCIAIDPDPLNGGAGSVSWTTCPKQAERLYSQMSIDPRRDGETLIRFDLQVPAVADDNQCQELASAAAWEQNYEEIRRLTVAVVH